MVTLSMQYTGSEDKLLQEHDRHFFELSVPSEAFQRREPPDVPSEYIEFQASRFPRVDRFTVPRGVKRVCVFSAELCCQGFPRPADFPLVLSELAGDSGYVNPPGPCFIAGCG